MPHFKLIKKGRKYWTCLLNDLYSCKLVINNHTNDLIEGEYSLVVNDISRRTSFGTELIFECVESYNPFDSNDETYILSSTPYNEWLVDEAHRLYGVWNAKDKTWIFPSRTAKDAQHLLEKYTSTLATIEVCVLQPYSMSRSILSISGFIIAHMQGKNTLNIPPSVEFINDLPVFSQDRYDYTITINQGTRFKITLPVDCINDLDQNFFSVHSLGKDG